ncbi:hypothetical protein HDV02_004842 [Globomyces sp. JEL0801]|nr:hypothetical protein HDV02_004842 [Globomyces sp. JEL0801]
MELEDAIHRIEDITKAREEANCDLKKQKFDNYEPFEQVTVPDSHQNNAFVAPQYHATAPERRHFSPTQPSRVSEIHESVNHNALDKHDLIPVNDLDISQNQSQSDAIHKPVAPTVFSRHRTNISADSRNQKSPGEKNIKKQEAVGEPQLNQSSIPKDSQTQFLRNATNPSDTNEQFSQRSNETSIQAKTIRNRTIPLKIAEPMNLNMKSPPTSESSVLVSPGKGEQNNPAPFTNAKQSDLDSSNKAEKMAQIQRDHEIENYEQKRLEREMERKKRDEQERQRILKEKLELDRKEELQKLKRIQEEKNRPMELNNNKSIKDVSVKQDVKIADETKEKEDAMSSIKALEKDPIMQKYLNLVKEKRGLNNESMLDPKVEKSKKPEEIDTAFGAGTG